MDDGTDAGLGERDGSQGLGVKPSEKQAAWMFQRYHYGKWQKQLEGRNGPGSCLCCPSGGPYAGKTAPKGFKGKGQYAD